MSESNTLAGAIERITYYNEENGYSVIKISPDERQPDAEARDGTVTVVGIMPELVEGESVEFQGSWVNNAQYGMQFKASHVKPIPPNSERGIIRYISDTVFGIGDVTAKRVYDYFGKETLNILDENPEAVHDVPGLKTQLADNLVKAWQTNRVERQIMVHLQSYGITANMAKKIFIEYGSDTLAVIQNDPYQLADDLKGVGFRKADEMAQGMGIERDAPQRIRSGVRYALSQLALEGHTYAPDDVLIEKTSELLGVSETTGIRATLDAQTAAQHLIGQKMFVNGDQIYAVYLPVYYYSETASAQRLKDMAESPSKIQFRSANIDWNKYLGELAERNNVTLSDEQQGAVEAALTYKVSVLTGGPGTGKTTTLQMVINALDDEDFEYRLASPTGRAAKRLAEATDREASTIHRLLGWNPQEGGFEYDEEYPLRIDMLVVDEASMIDLLLFHSLLKALPQNCHLMLVGDVDQLPSVGAGNVLNDVIGSNVGHVTRLGKIFRQAESSRIITNAHRINRGKMPETDNSTEDFFFFNIPNAEDAGSMIVDIVNHRIPDKFGYDPLDEVQVISPMYRSMAGVDNLNKQLQASLNPSSYGKFEKRLYGRIFRLGDKVMQTRNNYELGVYNGDIGFIKSFDDDENQFTVLIDGVNITYDYTTAEELIHAYCISTHRSQGSEYPVVVMPVLKQFYIMLQRNLLYTAITRARQMVILVGDRNAVSIAVNNNKVAERYSGLLPRLVGSVLDGRLF